MKTYYWLNRNRRLSHLRFVTALLLLSVLFISASSSRAEPAQTYHGTLTGGTFYCGLDQVAGPIVTGTWNLSIDPQTPAQLTLTVFYNGRQHLAWGLQRVDPRPIEVWRRSLCVPGIRRHGDCHAQYERCNLLLARRTPRHLPDPVSLRLVDVLGSGKPRRWISAAWLITRTRERA
jgi:hypothetical protein